MLMPGVAQPAIQEGQYVAGRIVTALPELNRRNRFGIGIRERTQLCLLLPHRFQHPSQWIGAFSVVD